MTNCTPVSTDKLTFAQALASLWRPAGALYLCFCAAGFAAGLWPDAVLPSKSPVPPGAPPVLSALAVGQAAFMLLIYPPVLFRRQQRGLVKCLWTESLVECVGLVVAAVPLYVAGAYLADAAPRDVVRSVLCLTALFPASWVAGRWMARASARPGVIVVLLLAAVGLPALVYLLAEFVPSVSRETIWRAGPLTFAWESAAARSGQWLPSPVWAWGLWPGAAAVGLALWLTTVRTRS